jgi:hypothetical protein
MRFVSVLVALGPGAVWCGGCSNTTSDETVSPPVEDSRPSVVFHSDADWLAIRITGGSWMTVPETSANGTHEYVFRVPPGGRYEIAEHSTGPGHNYVWITCAAQGETPRWIGVRQPPVYSLSGSITGLGGTESASMAMGRDLVALVSIGYPHFSMYAVPDGTSDLLTLVWRDATTREHVKLIRDLEIHERTSGFVVDVATGFSELNQHALTVTGGVGRARFATGNGTVARGFGDTNPTTGTGNFWYSLADGTLPKDGYSFLVTEPTVASATILRNYPAASPPEDLSFDLTAVSRTLAVTSTAVWPPTFDNLTYTPAATSPPLTSFSLLLEPYMDVGHLEWRAEVTLGCLAGGQSYALPDLAALPGFEATWGPLPDSQVPWWATAVMSNIPIGDTAAAYTVENVADLEMHRATLAGGFTLTPP